MMEGEVERVASVQQCHILVFHVVVHGWDKSTGCPGGTIIDCWDNGTSGRAPVPGPGWLHEKLLGYCLGGGTGAPDPIGRCHTGKPTKDPCSRLDVGGRTGDLDLSMITMLNKCEFSNLMLGN